MTVRTAGLIDLPYILRLEQEFCSLGFVGSDAEELHRHRIASLDCSYLVFELDGATVGFAILCGLNSVNRNIELKRVIVSEPGKGLGREGLRLIVRKAFCEMSAHRLWLDVYEDNERARRVYRALGFVEEGTIRECIWHGSRFRSLVLMSMLEDEFHALHSSLDV
jgi:diamine N-acetyltransferase